MSGAMRHSQRGTSRGGKKQSALKLHRYDCSINEIYSYYRYLGQDNKQPLYLPLLPTILIQHGGNVT